MRVFSCLCLLLCFDLAEASVDAVPPAVKTFLQGYCLQCHDADTAEADIVLSSEGIDWTVRSVQDHWERVLKALDEGRMPPAEADQPEAAERTAVRDWIHNTLLQKTEPGGTIPRRLSRAEYLATIKSVFGLQDFQLPAGFPADRKLHGFNNLAEGMLLSPPLLEAYAETATLVADALLPPPRKDLQSVVMKAEPKDLVISYSSALLTEGALRLGMKCDPIQRSCTWPGRIEIRASGEYRIRIDLSQFRPRDPDQAMQVRVLARDVSSSDGVSHRTLRVLQELEVTSETPQQFEFIAELYTGQTVVVHYANAPLDSDSGDREQLKQFFVERNREQPRYLDAWDAMLSSAKGQGFRGGLGWERVKQQLADEQLPVIDEKQQQALLKKIAGNTVLHAETVVFDVFENGPALQIHGLSVAGPLRLIDGPQELQQQRIRKRLLGDGQQLEAILRRVLTAAFGRPVSAETLQAYVGIYQQHAATGRTADEALHLVIRSALISPRFLYRCLPDHAADDWDLAARLSYFLTGGPPDGRLLAKAESGTLSDTEVLRKQAERLLPLQPDSAMIVQFTEQWLSTDQLADIMPDPMFKFTEKDGVAAKLEVEHFFAEILRENRPLTDFIDPDFTWTSKRLAERVYGLSEGYDAKQKDANRIQRVTLQRGGRVGGLLGQSAVMLTTANGVDTQPVLRGVWVLENILGDPPPPPPQAVPPITPDTTAASSPRDLLQKHTSDTACAACHRRIDPPGLLLENFDPVGRWRDRWPGSDQAIDSSVVMPDGTPLSSVVELRSWLVQNIDRFGCCLSEKLLTWATGRVLNFSERQEVAEIVRRNLEHRGGMRDLLLALIDSKTFRAR